MALSRDTLEVALRAVGFEVKSFVEGGTFDEDWQLFGRMVAAAVELDAELTQLENRGEDSPPE